MKRRLLRASVLTVLALLAATSAFATVRNQPVKLRRVGPPPVLRTGERATLSFELAAARPARVALTEVRSTGLGARLARPLAVQSITPDAPLRFDVEVTPTESPEPLVVTWELDGVRQEQIVDLGRLHETERARREALVQVSDASINPRPLSPAEQAELREPVPADDDPNLLPMKPSRTTEPGSALRSIRVRGRLIYKRDADAADVGADHVWVRIMNENSSWPDEILASGYTDAYGYYDLSFNWPTAWYSEAEPDIYARFETESGVVIVQSAGAEIEYGWRTYTVNEYTGTDLQLGTHMPANRGEHGALHIFTNIRRGYRWYSQEQGINVTGVDVQWPDGATGAYYDDWWNEIHVGTDRTWREDTHLHEYGHHFMYYYAITSNPDYCNGVCDSGSCGHCIWCAETDHDALNEGWPNWIAHVQTSDYAARYGLASVFTRDMESVQMCDATNFGDPWTTEGAIGAVLQDIWDPANDTDPNRLGIGMDVLALGTGEIFEVLQEDLPTTPATFMNAFRARYPQHTAALWQTAINSRLDVDDAPPSPLTGLTSSSHVVNQSSQKSMIDLNWNASTDEWSGIAGYELYIDFPAPNPDEVYVLGTATVARTNPLPPGNYYIRVRAIDRSGKYGQAMTLGPYVLVQPQPADLVFVQPAGWTRAIVPRPTADATTTNVQGPAYLPGNTADTWVNYAFANTGSQQGLPGVPSYLMLDGALLAQFEGTLAPGQTATVVNRGPFTVRGGRHYLGGYMDFFHNWVESSESNNTFCLPWVWTAAQIPAAGKTRRASPPTATAGWSLVRDPIPLFPACDGLRLSPTGYWNAAWIAADNDTSDYDCRIHFPTSNADTGFATPRGSSLRGAGQLDMVIANRRQANMSWHVGVNKVDFDAGDYVVGHAISQSAALGDSFAVTLADSEYVRIYEVNLPGSTGNASTVTIQADPADGPLYAAFLNSSFTVGGLSDAAVPRHAADANGRIRFNTYNPAAGYCAVVIYRDPMDGRQSRSFVLDLDPLLPNPKMDVAFGWGAPLVPRPAADGSTLNVPKPDTLHGNAASTYLNWFTYNPGWAGTAPAGTMTRIRLDGTTYAEYVMPAWTNVNGSGSTYWQNEPNPGQVRGGRHTFSIELDADHVLEEWTDDDNVYGEQYAWSPYPLAAGTRELRNMPPDRVGGWEHVRSGEPLWFNSDGIRVPVLSNGAASWAGIAVMPSAAGSDVDLQLHELLDGAKNGFAESFAVSSWGPGELDYVVMDFGVTARRSLDAGITTSGGPAAPYSVQPVSATVTELSPAGRLGPITYGGAHLFRLYEITLQAGTYRAHLTNVAGAQDWLVAIHARGDAFQSRAGALGSAWSEGPGMDEEFSFTTTASGPHLLVVGRATPDLLANGTFQIDITPEQVAVEDDVPTVTGLRGAAPNPFRVSAGIAFDLTRDSDVRLEVLDVRGARVRTLASGRWSAGRHRIGWDGRGDGGRVLPSGLYFVRLEAEGRRWSTKVAKVE